MDGRAWSSPHFTCLPWVAAGLLQCTLESDSSEASNLIQTTDQPVVEEQRFIDALRKEHFSAEGLTSKASFQRFLGGGIGNGNLSDSQLDDVVSRLFGFRFLEACLLIRSLNADPKLNFAGSDVFTAQAQVLETPPLSVTACLKDLDSYGKTASRLSDWVSLLREAIPHLEMALSASETTSTRDHSNLDNPDEGPGLSPTGEQPNSDSKGSKEDSLCSKRKGDSALRFARMYSTQKKAKAQNILANFDTAIFHAGYLLDGHVDFTTTKVLQKYLKEQGYDDFPGDIRLAELRGPLRLAVFLSPLCLYIPVQFDSRAPSKVKCFNAWRIFGTFQDKPKLIKVLEGYTFNVIRRCATTRCSSVDALRPVLELFKLIVKCYVGHAIRHWFSPYRCIPFSSNYSEDDEAAERRGVPGNVLTPPPTPFIPGPKPLVRDTPTQDSQSLPVSVPMVDPSEPLGYHFAPGTPNSPSSSSGLTAIGFATQPAMLETTKNIPGIIPPSSIQDAMSMKDLVLIPSDHDSQMLGDEAVEFTPVASYLCPTTGRPNLGTTMEIPVIEKSEITLQYDHEDQADCNDSMMVEGLDIDQEDIDVLMVEVSGNGDENEVHDTADVTWNHREASVNPYVGSPFSLDINLDRDECQGDNINDVDLEDGRSDLDEDVDSEAEEDQLDSDNEYADLEPGAGREPEKTRRRASSDADRDSRSSESGESEKETEDDAPVSSARPTQGTASSSRTKHSPDKNEQQTPPPGKIGKRSKVTRPPSQSAFKKRIALAEEAGGFRYQEVIDLTLDSDSKSTPNLLSPEQNPIEKRFTTQKTLDCIIPGTLSGMGFVPVICHAEDLSNVLKVNDLRDAAASQSTVKILDFKAYESATACDILRHLRTQHILVLPDVPISEKACMDTVSSELLRKHASTLGPLTKKRVITDLSLPPSTVGREVIGTTSDLLSSIGSSDGKPLVCTDYSQWRDFEEPQPYESDAVLWMSTHEQEICRKRDQYPISSLRIGSFATRDAYRIMQNTPSGMGMFMTIRTGAEMWYIATPKNPASIDCGGFRSFDSVIQRPSDWIVEHVLLMPGVRIILQPNTVVLAVTVTPAVALGGYFLATSTLRQTLYGILQAFAHGDWDERQMQDTFMLLSHMSIFYHEYYVLGLHRESEDEIHHVPDISTMEGILDVVLLACVMELGNVLNPWGYSSSNQHERVRIIHARRRLRELLREIFGTYQMKDYAGDYVDGLAQIFWPWLVQIASALLLSRREAEKGRNCSGRSSEELNTAIQRCFQREPNLFDLYISRCECSTPRTFEWKGPVYEVSRRMEGRIFFVPLDGYTFDDIDRGIIPTANNQSPVKSERRSIKRKRSDTASAGN